MRNPIDSLVGFFSPVAAVRRAQARRVMAYYEAANPSRLRKFRRDQGGPNRQTQQGAVAIRTQARHADQNHDIARGILDTLVNNTIGPKGIEVEPQPRATDGSIQRDYARDLLRAWRAWTHRPEVTGQHNWGQVQRLLARTWYRDGESFGQLLSGPIPSLRHGSPVPFSIEMLEPDMIPYDYHDLGRRIRQGIQTNAWGRPIGYWVYKQHPHDNTILAAAQPSNLKFVPAERVFHAAGVDRIGQQRGVSIFASVINRLEDIKDYEESERVAAKISAMLTAYVKRTSPDGVDPDSLPRDEDGNVLPREIGLEPGAIIDTLQVGEEIDTIDSKRPNPNLVGFRHGQLRALAAGTRTTASSISKTYDGSYSAQRQEMVENWSNYASLADEFVGDVVQPVWQAFVRAANLSGVVPRPPDVAASDADDALYLAQSMPWIDPAKEARAWHQLVRDGFASEVEVIRKRGANPSDVLEQMASWRERTDQAGLSLDSNSNPRPSDPGGNE
ncbi:MAG TPA: phage portal protein [Guyparkeria sp.]|nr:phage portal protein [Guyparkeria sp.]